MIDDAAAGGGGRRLFGAPPSRARITVLFKTGLAFVFLAAFLSLAVQLKDLVGSRGLLPLHDLLERYRAAGAGWPIRLHDLPTLFWIASSDRMITALPLAGALLSIAWIFGAGGRAVPLLLWLLYLSGITAGRDFFFYQWDNLLLETSFLAIALPARGSILAWARRRPPPEPSPWVIALLKWVLFRLLFESALAKIVYGADDWLTLKGMTYYYETAPLPSWGGWLVQQLPLWFHQMSVFITFLCELVLPFLLFARSRALRLAFVAVNGCFQISIALTSNYGFFNLLAIVLSLTVLQDDDRGTRPAAAAGPPTSTSPPRPRSRHRWAGALRRIGPWLLAACIVPASLVEGLAYFFHGPLFYETLAPVRRLYAPLRSVNVYHLFPGILRQRIVAEIEGTQDGIAWRPIRLRYAPGDPAEPPPMTFLHNPRFPFTWSFLTLGRGPRDAEYLHNLLDHLCCDPRALDHLMEPNPFEPGKPTALRLVYYRYRFGTWKDRRESGRYWLREQVRPPSRPYACTCLPAS